jgi:regulatory protein YycI of two-component signal transduction system YycFG
MDWSRAKSILILIFVLLNVYLLIYLGIYIKNSNITKEAVTNTLNILKKNGVVLDPTCTVPKYNKRTPMLILENEDGLAFSEEATSGIISLERNISGLNSDLDLNNTRNLEKHSRDYLLSRGIKVPNFILDRCFKNINNSLQNSSSDETVTLIFIEKFKNFLIFDNEISLIISKRGIQSAISTVKRIKGFTKTNSLIMPAHQVLLKKFYNEKDIVIKSIDIGFKGFDGGNEELESKETSQSPAWRITTGDGREIFLKAYDGEEI